MKNQENTNKQDKAFSSINFKSFIMVTAILVVILAIAGIISNFIPQGAYQYNEKGEIIPDTYTAGSVAGIAFWRVLTAPFRVFASDDGLTIIMISFPSYIKS